MLRKSKGQVMTFANLTKLTGTAILATSLGACSVFVPEPDTAQEAMVIEAVDEDAAALAAAQAAEERRERLQRQRDRRSERRESDDEPRDDPWG
jgi:hypothetical protein